MTKYIVRGWYGRWYPYDFTRLEDAREMYKFLKAAGRKPKFTRVVRDLMEEAR